MQLSPYAVADESSDHGVAGIFGGLLYDMAEVA
jgi:hypothetical protein